MQSYRIVLEYTDAVEVSGHPETWSWWDLLNISPSEALSVVKVENIETPAEHLEDIMQDGLGQDAADELTEIAQKHDMGYPRA